MTKFLKLATAVLLVSVLLSACSSEPETPLPVTKWYEALKTADEAAFAELLDDDAKIELISLEITQTKAEFIAALDNWQEVVQKLELIPTLVETGEATAELNVCYRFSTNTVFNREMFEFSGNVITRQSQQKIADSC